jgi:acetyl esterase/lipase
MTHLDDEIAAAMAAAGLLPAITGGPVPSLATLGAMRAVRVVAPIDPTPPPGVVRDELVIDGDGDGRPPVHVRVYRHRDRAASNVPALLWMHGGGYIFGSYDMDAPRLDRLVATTGCVAVSVEYRLAPEHPYPAAHHDCRAALLHVVDHADALGIDARRIAVGGVSAGGGLAAALALFARDAGVALVHQHLIYPMIDDSLTTPSSAWDTVPIWRPALNRFAWQCYLGDGDGDMTYAAAARADDVAGVAPAYIHVGSADGFLHEDVHYAARLLAAGVPTELHVFPGAPHGFDGLAPDATISRTAGALADLALRRAWSET